ncbi:efflux transporter outer membrane subunit [Geomesophilobacter sediminis]|uniref:Efflux transporter outer membrane subunit n=1 Tax=Geomesophilobacter sediminis TaxID=2798584 RepID=A0A8J7M122_9BACT|nr:efflux transporter outer membrane subunit [Geomesophilobacter sediminis]MBJ6726683.1 efflux transporter outer membrane subunit [Geomesophilobacter sediminis]
MKAIRLVINSMLAAALGLAGCTVGPDFRAPEPPAPSARTATVPPAEKIPAQDAAGGEQRFVVGGEIPAQWWRLFQSEKLDGLIRQALKQSPTIEAAAATLRQAQENLTSRRGALKSPKVDANLGVNREHVSGAAFGAPGSFDLTLYQASVNVSYDLDLFGGGRRELEGLAAQIGYQRFQLEGAHLALSANIVTAAVSEASARARIAATKELIALQERLLALVEEQQQFGAASLPDVLAQRSQLAQLRANLPPLEKELEQTRHRLAVLSGRFPGDPALPAFTLEELRLPRDLPVSLPSALVRQRPDIRGAEELFHAASADIGVATANLYPQISLTGTLGTEALNGSGLFNANNLVWGLGGSLVAPIFHGGELKAKKRAAVAAFEAAGARYRETVLEAFQNVADVLQALDRDAATLVALGDAETVARQSFEVSRDQYGFGVVSYLTLLNAERQYQEARLAVVPARAAGYADTAALFQAVGGGWWNRPPEEKVTQQGAGAANKDAGSSRNGGTQPTPSSP